MAKSFKTAKTIKLFLDECGEYLTTLNQDLVELEQGNYDVELMKRIARNIHTIKGSSGMLEFLDISEISHIIEDILDNVRMQIPNVDKALIDAIFSKVDEIETLLGKIAAGAYEESVSQKTQKKELAEKISSEKSGAMRQTSDIISSPPTVEQASTATKQDIFFTKQSAQVLEEQRIAIPCDSAIDERINLFKIFGDKLSEVLQRYIVFAKEIENKFVVVEDNLEDDSYLKNLLDSIQYLHRSLVCLGVPEISQVLRRGIQLFQYMLEGKVKRQGTSVELIFSSVAHTKLFLQKLLFSPMEKPDIVVLMSDFDGVRLKIDVDKFHLGKDTAQELFERLTVEETVCKYLSEYEKFLIAHAMINGFNVLHIKCAFVLCDIEDAKNQVTSVIEIFKPLYEKGDIVACVFCYGRSKEILVLNLFYSTSLAKDDVVPAYNFLKDLNRLSITSISLTKTTAEDKRQKTEDRGERAGTQQIPASDTQEISAKTSLSETISKAVEKTTPPAKTGRKSSTVSVSDDAQAATTSKGDIARSTIRVDTEKLDVLVNLVAELVIRHNKMEKEIKTLSQNINKVGEVITRLKLLTKATEFSEFDALLHSFLDAFKGSFIPQYDLFESKETVLESILQFKDLGTLYSQLEYSLDLENEKDISIKEIFNILVGLKKDFNTLSLEFQNDGLTMGSVIGELQDETMKMRMLPVSRVFSKFPRRVRDIAKTLGKKVDFIIEGEETELDKTLIEELEEPMLHLIRNAIDHGVETEDMRIKLGKNPEGRIKVKAYHEGNLVVIEVEDDGKGLDVERIKNAAINKKLINASDAEQLDPKEVLDLIFTPGFSTAEKVSDLSGRGVGMDVVKNSIQRLKGVVGVSSEVGVGTTFRLKLPLTLAIIQAMIVRVFGQRFVIPMDPIEATIKLTPYSILSIENKAVFRYEEQNLVLPLVKLSDIFSLSLPENEALESFPVVVVGVSDKKIGLMVDEVVEKQQVVIKSLGSFLGDIKYIAGATMFGDGSVALILDVASIVSETARITKRIERQWKGFSLKGKKKILLIDDSLSTRMMQKDSIEKFGFKVDVASSGISALGKLMEQTYDLIVTDVNMPQMDGYEFSARVRALDTYKRIPIVMVTSDTKRADRERGFEVGVNEYLVKPFTEDDLKKTIEKYLK